MQDLKIKNLGNTEYDHKKNHAFFFLSFTLDKKRELANLFKKKVYNVLSVTFLLSATFNMKKCCNRNFSHIPVFDRFTENPR